MALIEENIPSDNMHILLAKYLSREADANEITIVETWVAEKPENSKYLGQLQLIWEESKKFRYDKKIDTQQALEKFRQRTAIKSSAAIFNMRWLRVASIVLIIVGIAAILKLNDQPKIKAAEVLKFMAGNVAESDTLPDGSVVLLHPHAELVCPAQFAGNLRSVALKGNAYFSVSHDSTHPFQIAVNDVRVTVLGTSFEISGAAGNTKVVVMTGVVEVTQHARSIKVFPHEQLIVPASGSLWIKQSDTLQNIQSSQTTISKPLHKRTAATKTDSSVDDYLYHRQAMSSILSDLVKEGLATDKESIGWAALTDSVLILDGKAQPETLHQKLKTTYHVTVEGGYYYGPVKITGKGYFFDKTDFNK